MRRVIVIALLAAACEAPPGVAPGDMASPAEDAQVVSRADGGGGGFLRVVAVDDESGLPLPARALVTAVPPTPAVEFDLDPRTGKCPTPAQFGCGRVGVRLGPGVVGAPEGVLLLDGDGAFAVPPGKYDVFVTHGPEWEAHLERITLDGESNVVVSAQLRRSVDTTGFLAADLHIHTARSYDSILAVDDRVASEVTVGTELLVTTDHNVLSDLQPDLELLGYDRIARAIVGDEFNFAEGHGGAYPMPYDPMMPFGGTVEFGLDWDTVKGVSGGEMFDRLRQFSTHPAITVNHPRLPPDLGYFINLKQYG